METIDLDRLSLTKRGGTKRSNGKIYYTNSELERFISIYRLSGVNKTKKEMVEAILKYLDKTIFDINNDEIDDKVDKGTLLEKEKEKEEEKEEKKINRIKTSEINIDDSVLLIPIPIIRQRVRVLHDGKVFYIPDNYDKDKLILLAGVVRLRRKEGEVVQDCTTYIGRKLTMGGWKLKDSKWGNPFKVGKDGTLEEVVTKYYNYIKNSNLVNDIKELRGETLGCFCDIVEKDRGFYTRITEPKCHGEVLLRLLYEMM